MNNIGGVICINHHHHHHHHHHQLQPPQMAECSPHQAVRCAVPVDPVAVHVDQSPREETKPCYRTYDRHMIHVNMIMWRYLRCTHINTYHILHHLHQDTYNWIYIYIYTLYLRCRRRNISTTSYSWHRNKLRPTSPLWWIFCSGGSQWRISPIFLQAGLYIVTSLFSGAPRKGGESFPNTGSQYNFVELEKIDEYPIHP